MSNSLSPEHKALIEGLIEKHTGIEAEKTMSYSIIFEAMSELITLLSPEWVSPESSLPEPAKRVLLYCRGRIPHEIIIGVYNGNLKMWPVWSSMDCYEDETLVVTGWKEIDFTPPKQ